MKGHGLSFVPRLWVNINFGNMNQNFLQLTFKNQTTGATVTTVTLTTDEVPQGLTRNAPLTINTTTTAEGRARTFQNPDGVTFSFAIVLSDAATLGKLDTIAAQVALGRTVDAQCLIGSMIYNATSDRLVYNASIGLLSGGVVTSFDREFRQVVGDGQRSRNSAAMVIRQGGANALPLAANYVGN